MYVYIPGRSYVYPGIPFYLLVKVNTFYHRVFVFTFFLVFRVKLKTANVQQVTLHASINVKLVASSLFIIRL